MIILAATPIGNLGDVSLRLREAFETVPVIACEDTRHTARLLRLLEIVQRPELVALHDHNEYDRAASLVARARTEDVLVVSDAGMPTVSDPGYRLVREAVVQGVPVTVIPGPSAVVTALALSGLPSDRFTFEGFIPKKEQERRTSLQRLDSEERTMVFFEAPGRLLPTLTEMGRVFGVEREAAVCRELTKMHEEVRRGTLDELCLWASAPVKGECVIVVRGGTAAQLSLEEGCERVASLVADGTRMKDAARSVAGEAGLSAKELYEAMLTRKKGSS